MERTTLGRLITMAALVLALALAGCGGDDGVDQSVHDMVTAERDANATALAAAQAAADMAATQAAQALAAAQQAQADALNAQTAAEAARDEARMGEADAITRAQTAESAATQAAADAKTAADAAMQAAADLKEAQDALAAAMMEATTATEGQMMAEMEAERLADADMAARAAGIIASMKAFISDADMDNAARATGAEVNTDLGITATDRDYDPDDVDAAVRTAHESTAFLDQTAYGDEAVNRTGTANDLEADVSAGQLNRPTGQNAPAGASVKYTAVDGVTATAAAPRGAEFTVVGYEAQDAGPPEIDGWDSGTLLRRDDGDAADQVLYYYTDIASAASGASFLVKYQGTSIGVSNANVASASSLTFPSAASPSLPLIGARTAVGTTVAIAAGDANHVPFAGTFDGVAGTFACVGLCTANYNAADGSISFLFGADGTVPATGTPIATVPNAANYLTFTPDDARDATTAVSGEHLVFGYWLHKPDNPAAAHQFMPFASGMAAYDVRGDDPATTAVERDDATLAAPAAPATDPDLRTTEVSLVHRLTGTARFKGPAAGKYITLDVLDQTAEIGQFTATAELLADFDAGTAVRTGRMVGTDMTTPQAPGMVSGVVRDFMDASGEEISNWHITLGNASLAAIGANPGINEGAGTGTIDVGGTATARRDPAALADNTFNGRTEAGMSITQFTGDTDLRMGGAETTGAGRWVGQFRGNARLDGNPNAISGVFDAHADYGSISGAFGSYNTAAE